MKLFVVLVLCLQKCMFVPMVILLLVLVMEWHLELQHRIALQSTLYLCVTPLPMGAMVVLPVPVVVVLWLITHPQRPLARVTLQTSLGDRGAWKRTVKL